jgi:hypothetical protein
MQRKLLLLWVALGWDGIDEGRPAELKMSLETDRSGSTAIDASKYYTVVSLRSDDRVRSIHVV